MNWKQGFTSAVFTVAIALSAATPLDLGEKEWKGAPGQTMKNGMNVYSFDGKNSISFRYQGLPASFSFSAWAKPDPAALKGTPFLTRIGYHTQIGIHSDGRFYFHTWNEFKKPLFLFGPKAEAGKWAFVVGTYSRKTGNMTLYVNGEKVAEQKIKEDLLKTTDQFSLAASHNKNPFYSGKLCQIKIFGTALTADQVQKLAQEKPE